MSLLRDAILAGSTNVWLREKAMRAPFVRRSVSRFMPGERIEDAIDAARELKVSGITTILTRLGENLTEAAEADEVTAHYLNVMSSVKAAGLDARSPSSPPSSAWTSTKRSAGAISSRFSTDPTHSATSSGSTWRARRIDRTLALSRGAGAVEERWRGHSGVCPFRQGHRVARLARLRDSHRQGRAKEPPDLAYPKKADVDENYFRLVARLLEPDAVRAGCLVHIGTHDDALIDRIRIIKQNGVSRDAHEFAMLYGIRRQLQQRLVAGGEDARAHQLRGVLVPVVHAPPRRAPREHDVRVEEYVSALAAACPPVIDRRPPRAVEDEERAGREHHPGGKVLEIRRLAVRDGQREEKVDDHDRAGPAGCCAEDEENPADELRVGGHDGPGHRERKAVLPEGARTRPSARG